MKILLFFISLTISSLSFAGNIDEIRVFKSQHRMEFITQGKVVKTYHVMLGRGGKLPKLQRGDNRVPEGQYIIDYKNPNSLFHKSLHISYPNDEDKRRATEAGVEPGGDIMIHGLPNRPSRIFKFLKRIGLIKLIDWTAGCVAVDNSAMDSIYDAVDELTPVNIYR
jgi:murein L,D-transpeptidase YafK